MEGYHSPQVDVDGAAQHQRVARSRRRPRGVDALAAELVARRVAPLPRPRRHASCGRRIAALHGVGARAGVRRQRLERGAADAAASPTAAPGRTVATFEPTYALHGHIARLTGTERGRGRARRRLHARPRRGATGCSPRAEPAITFLCSPNNPTGMVEPRGGACARCSTWRPACVVVDEAYGQFAPWSALDLVDDDAPARRHPHVLQDVVDGGGPPRLPRRPGVARGRAREGGAAVPPRRASSRRPGAWPCDFADEMEARVAPLVEERGRLGAALRRPAASTCGRRAPTSCCSGRAGRDGARRVAGAARPRRCSSATARRGPASTAACGSPSARRPRTTRFLAALDGGPGVSRAAARRAARTHEGDRRSPSTSTSTAPARVEVSTGLPFFDHMLDQLGRHGGFDLTVAGHRRPRTSTATTPSRTSASLLGEAFREALGDKAGVRRFASGLYPLDEALVEVALDLSGRPFVVWDVAVAGEALPLGNPPFDPQLAEHVLAVVRHGRRHHAARHAACAAATPTTSSRRRSRAWPAACATPCGSRAPACRRPRASL